MKTEVLFRDVKLGESFEFHCQLLACEAVKAEFATVTFENGRSKKSNFVITKILQTAANSFNRKPGDYEFCPDEGIAIVHRTLPSGN